ncbi:MAG TPA: hypothetical protein PKY88_12835 [Anaerohalosphaeraceae bacterium]|nr:hypothetical protein [Anaerohalosphaeraceae bacterium]
MKSVAAVFMVAVVSVTVCHANVLVYEGFGEAINGNPLTGYIGTSKIGLSGTWIVNAGQEMSLRTGEGGQWGQPGPNWPVAEHTAWWLTQASRPLSSSIDLTGDGSFYMSFLFQSDQADHGSQVGLANASSELMAGNAYSGAADKGITAYYGALNGGFQTNCNGTFIDGNWRGEMRDYLVVIMLNKYNSGTTDDLEITLEYYRDTVYDGSPDASRTIALTGITDTFTHLAIKADGWVSIDEIRLGHSLSDVIIPEPATFSLLGLGLLVSSRKWR